MTRHRALGRLTTLVAATLMGVSMAGTPAGSASSQSSAPPEFVSKMLRDFSPDGDGFKDTIRVTYDLPQSARPTIRVLRYGKRMFDAPLGRQQAGRHSWTWDGRLPNGRTAPHSTYEIQLRANGTASTFVELDLKFQARLDVAGRFGRPRREATPVYPRSRVIRDLVALEVLAAPSELARGVLTIKRRGGEVVARRSLTKDTFIRTVRWSARDGRGRPLPPGRYVAQVSGRDKAGNSGRTEPVRLWVSADRLVWHEETRVVSAEEALASSCGWDTEKDCETSFDCGTIAPSTRTAGALTYRAGACDDAWNYRNRAYSGNLVPVDEAVRGVDRIRVAFTGTPTTPGESDLAHLRVAGDTDSVVASSTTAQSTWVEHPAWGDGQSAGGGFPRVPAGAYWMFWTENDDSFDVASFTVDLRYLTPAR